MKTDYLIIGQGLAGTVLAYTLLKTGKKVFIINHPLLSSCSRVSAGNYNPVVFKRLAKSWKAEHSVPFADDFYNEAQQLLKTKFFWKKEIFQLFSDEQEKNLWERRSSENACSYLSKKIVRDFHTDIIDNPLGAGVVTEAGNLYVEKFIEEFRKYFFSQAILLEEQFDFNQLKMNESNVVTPAGAEENAKDYTVHYKNITAKKIIFCEGWRAMKNPLFSYLPFKPAKGEALVVKMKKFPPTDKIIHKGISLFHIGDDLFFCGATYQWEELNDFPTEKGQKEIIEKLKKFIKIPFEVVEQKSGVRPSTKDRKPFIGLHPEKKCVGIFNGLGTKAVMLAPYFAKQFFDFLEKGSDLDDEVNIERFNSFNTAKKG